jgi:3-oxoacyl-[acyl-carrier protein] reductase
MGMRRTILITGSAKRLGAGLAKGLARDGHRIAVHFRTSKHEAEEVRQSILEAGGDGRVFGNPLADLADGERLVRDVVEQWGSLDTLINNAGAFPHKHFEELSQEDWETGIASSAGAAFFATRGALAWLRASGRGRIINIGDSMSDRIGLADPGMSYYVGKAGLCLMTRTLAATEARHKITVNMVSPGVLDDSLCKTPLAEMPLGRYGTYEDVLRPIRFLLEEGSETLTGSNLQVGGGWNLAR